MEALTSQITTKEIFQNGEILTLEKLKTLFGKKIACTSSEYRANSPHIEIFTPKEIKSAFELADLNTDFSGFESQAKYWESYMKKSQLDEQKTKFHIVDEFGGTHYCCHSKYYNYYEMPTFTGSDADREVYFIEL